MEQKQKNVILSLIPAFVVAVLFLMAWTEPDVDLQDPWYRTLNKFNETRALQKENPELYNQKIQEVGKEFEELATKYSFHPKVRMLNGYYLMSVGKNKEAIEELKVAIEDGKGGLVNQIEFQAGDMLSQIALGRTNQLFEQARNNKDPKNIILANNILLDVLPYISYNPDIHFQLGKTNAEMGDYYKALEYYENAIKRNPKHEGAGRGKAHLNFLLGNKFIGENNFNQAYIHYRIAQSIIPNHPDYNNNLGNTCLKLNKFDEAVKHFGNANKNYPDNRVFKGNLEIAKKALAQSKNQNR
ncbi:tetratricopeptide repeat protein [Candidatus Kapabacteria bacterium]|nr:tetratricopeptide repeat protein [Candidatus Kapabacteria bacterium]